MRLLDLFSGIGGFAYAAQQVWDNELEIVAFCEIDKFCQKVLKKHWPDTEIINDIRDERIRQFRDIDLLTAGVPCQPASVAGQKRGSNDERWLWPETIEIIRLVRPCYAILENVPGLFSLESGLALNGILSGLAESGYDCWWETIPACAVGACHRRDRIWIVAVNSEHIGFNAAQNRQGNNKRSDTNSQRQNEMCEPSRPDLQRSFTTDTECIISTRSITGRSEKRKSQIQIRNSNRDDTNPQESGLEGQESKRQFRQYDRLPAEYAGWNENWPEVATRLCRVDDGVSNRVDRLKTLGNAIVPQVAMVIMHAIGESESTGM